MRYLSSQVKLSILVLLLSVACGVRSTETFQGNRAKNSQTPQIGSNKSQVQAPSELCNRISDIKAFPMKGERGEDATYDALMNEGDAVVPCLIDKVTDSTVMNDPRSEPGYPDVEIRVGDIAYFLLVDITKLGFTEPFPPSLQRDYKREGVYAYFKFVKKQENRMLLQHNLHDWYDKKRRRS
jgi:hypothetical protein